MGFHHDSLINESHPPVGFAKDKTSTSIDNPARSNIITIESSHHNRSTKQEHRYLTKDDRSRIDRKHYLRWLKSFFLLEIEQLASDRTDRGDERVNLKARKYALSQSIVTDIGIHR